MLFCIAVAPSDVPGVPDVPFLGVFCYIMVCGYCVAVAPGDALCAISWCVLLHYGVLFCVAVAPGDGPCVICWCVLLQCVVLC